MKKITEAYELIKKECLDDIHSQGWLLRHKKTGARIMLIENEDENKVFNIAFRTPPSDSTGVAHILEHSVLCGSEKFPLKDPFVELVKGSLNTFLNAMTYPDKTTYPVASCNDQDFQNLLHVYLDAVFFPNIYKRPEIFRQEGWNYHLEDLDGELTYNGVVYNEMKGAFSSPDEVLEREIMNGLFPDTCYGWESGGDPAVIPELTYEQFLDFHRKYYHPSNSYIYLYGNMDMEEKLEFLDKEYLSRFDYLEIDSKIPVQKPFSQKKEIQLSYPISENETQEDNTYLSYSAVAGNTLDTKLTVAFEILDYALLSAPGAPLKQALQDAGIGKDIYGAYDDGIFQPYFTIVAKGSSLEKKQEFLKIIRDTLENIAKEGLSRKALEAGINFYEFRYREADFSSYPKGLMYCLDIMGDWLYDSENPFAQVQQLKIFQELKDERETGYFESLITEYLLDNPHSCVLALVPEKGLQAKREGEIKEKLKSLKESLSREELEKLVRQTRLLKEYQESEEDPAHLACIPMLKREDIRRKASRFYNREEWEEDTLLLHHPVDTNGIGYLTLLFDLEKIPASMVPYVGLLKSVLGYVDTEHYAYGQLFNEINASTGGIYHGVEVYEDTADLGRFKAMYAIKGKALYEKMSFMFSMIEEVLFSSKLEDEKRLYEIIAQVKSRAQAGLVSAGHGTAVLRAASYASMMAKFQDEMSGIGYYHFVEQLEKNFQEKKEEIIENLKKLTVMIFRKELLKVSFTGDQHQMDKIRELVRSFKKKLYTQPVEQGSLVWPLKVKNEGLKTSGQVQYVAQTGNFVEKGLTYTGALNILKVILSYDYLWNEIRVKGGAYGCMSGFKRNGESYFVSYRDPHLAETLKVYENMTDYLEHFQADEREMTKYIIGTISGRDIPKTPQMKGNISRAAYFSHVTEEMMQKERDQILDATAEDIRNLSKIVKAILEDHHICVVGSESMIEKEKELFGEISHLIS